jgi:hypothetical protein
MRFFPSCLVLAVLASIVNASAALAQSTQAGNAAASKNIVESSRQKRKALEDESAQKQRRREEWDQRTLEAVEARDRKRADCRKQATAQNLHLMKRVRFIRRCMTLP